MEMCSKQLEGAEEGGLFSRQVFVNYDYISLDVIEVMSVYVLTQREGMDGQEIFTQRRKSKMYTDS